jgi:hypothetical protein
MKTSKKIIISISILSLAAISTIFLNGFGSSSEKIAAGCFHQVAHRARGCAVLIRQPDGQVFLRLEDFKTSRSADLHILLISAFDALENETVKNSERLYVAPLEKFEGSQQYVVPNAENLTKFHSVTIWNSRHGVNFTTAPMKKF